LILLNYLTLWILMLISLSLDLQNSLRVALDTLPVEIGTNYVISIK
jgi:hypothetical protein